ncbi:NACHT domain-containing protein [Advenella kashmirensis]
MYHPLISRTLWYQENKDKTEIPQTELHLRTEPLVVLGEAGMGKTSLLQWLAHEHHYAYCTARKLILRADPTTLINDSGVLVIDALDEVSAFGTGDNVGRVLQRLGELGYPRFILSCRVADWRSATGTEVISEQYDQTPLQLHLAPLNVENVHTFLNDRLGSKKTDEVITHFDRLGLNNWLGNPQTLQLIIPAIANGGLPKSRAELFELAVNQLAAEHNDAKADTQLPQATVLAAAGAACAVLILTGRDAITRKATLNAPDDELTQIELTTLPDGQHIEHALGTRLFIASSPDSFRYYHRSIGEYLGAKWLAQQANTPRKRRRLLALFHQEGIVPANLRGIHAWLAQDPKLAHDVIAVDPLSLIEYGDTKEFTAGQAQVFLQALEQLAIKNPYFRDWRNMACVGLAQPALLDQLRLLVKQIDKPYGLRLLVLESLIESNITKALRQELVDLVGNTAEPYGLRSAAGAALTGVISPSEWVSIVKALENNANENSSRLALELMHSLTYESFDEALIARIVCSFATKDEKIVGPLFTFERTLPADRLFAFLDQFVQLVQTLVCKKKFHGKSELANTAFHLIMRSVQTGRVGASQLWRWIEPFCERDTYHNESTRLIAYLQNNDELRQSVQQLVLLEKNEQNLRKCYWSLQECSSGFKCSEADAVALLNALNPSDVSDDRWRDIVQLVPHNDESGAEVRAAARIFASQQPNQMLWLEQLTNPPAWELDKILREKKSREEKEQKLEKCRQWHIKHIEQIRQGDFSAVLFPAQVYLGTVEDVDAKTPPSERIAQWLGTEFSDPAYRGFEAYLESSAAIISATEILRAFTEQKLFEAEYIIVAALCERLRNGIGFRNLSDERIVAGFFILCRMLFREIPEILLLVQQIETEIQERGLLPQAIRQLVETQLHANCNYIIGLSEFMQEDKHEELAVTLANEWLKFPDLSHDTEVHLINRLLRSSQHEMLTDLAVSRIGVVSGERSLRWDVVGLIVDFESARARLSTKSNEIDLLWHIRDCTSGDRYETGISPTAWTAKQLEWIISTFRTNWPIVSRPQKVSMGNRNSWDACEFLISLINRLGGDVTVEGVTAMSNLVTAPIDSYTARLLAVSSEQNRILFESSYTPPSLTEICAISLDSNPGNLIDLQVLVLEELNVVQNKIRSDDAESWRGFFNESDIPKTEEQCRDHLLGLLRQGDSSVRFEPETHVASDKEVDITCAVGTLRLPIEVKGQWHKELWTATDKQLDNLYASDWRAGGRGIYLVLWFGTQSNENKNIRSPGRNRERPNSPEQMTKMLIACSKAAQERRIEVVVLDLTRQDES